MSVESGYGTPPALEGRSCLYVLRYSASVGVPSESESADKTSATPTANPDGTNEENIPSDGGPVVKDGVVVEENQALSKVGQGKAWREGGMEEAGVWFYVGESDAIRERLRQHARRWGGRPRSGEGLTASDVPNAGIGGGSCKLDAIVIPTENRSDSRRLETEVIRAMKEEGFHLVADKDGSRTHFSSF